MTGQRARMRTGEIGEGIIGEERRVRDETVEADDRFRLAMQGAGYQASEPVRDDTPLVGTKFHAEPTSLGNSSMAGI